MKTRNEIFDKIEKEINAELLKFGCTEIKVDINQFETSIESAYVISASWFTLFGDYETRKITYYGISQLIDYESIIKNDFVRREK